MRGEKHILRALAILVIVSIASISWQMRQHTTMLAADLTTQNLSTSTEYTITSNIGTTDYSSTTYVPTTTYTSTTTPTTTDTTTQYTVSPTTTYTTVPTTTTSDNTIDATSVSTSTTTITTENTTAKDYTTATTTTPTTTTTTADSTISSETDTATYTPTTNIATDTTLQTIPVSSTAATSTDSTLTIEALKDAISTAVTNTVDTAAETITKTAQTITGTSATPSATTTTQTNNASNDSSYQNLPTINLDNQIESPIVRSRKMCFRLKLNKTASSVIFKLQGPTNRTFEASEMVGDANCFNLIIDDLPNGDYKLIVEAQVPEVGLASGTTNISIRKELTLASLEQKITSVFNNECASLGITDTEKCKLALFDKYAGNIQCEGLSQDECSAALKQTYMQTITFAQKEYAQIKEKMPQIENKELTASDLEAILNQGTEDLGISVPLQNKETKIKTIKAIESILISKEQGLIQAAPIAITIDTDGDGIPDDTEKRIGTDPLKADTDGDGYDDTEEIRAGYDPLGPGKKDTRLSPIDKALIENMQLYQPKGSGTEQSGFSIDKVENTTAQGQAEENGYIFTGKAQPDTVITLYIYSDIPIVTTVTTDQYGNWQYHFDQQLEDGDHEVYVAVNDNTGKVVSKSKPFFLPIKEARAQDLTISMNQDSAKSSFNNMVYYYAFFAIILIISAIAIFVFAVLRQRNKPVNPIQ